MDFPSEYVVFHYRGGIRCFALVEYFEPLREGMRGGNPAVDHVDMDGEKGVANCQHIDILYLSTADGRAMRKEFESFINDDEKEKEAWEK